MANDPVLAKYSEKFIDSESGEPIKENGGCYVEFFMEAEVDPLLTEGGELFKSHAKVKEVRKLEAEILARARQDEPFTAEEPQPPKNKDDQAAQRAYQQAHADWDRQRVDHEADLIERHRLLRDHQDNKDVFVVSPASRPIYVDREYIRIVVPGDKDNMPVRPVRKSDIEGYRAQYDRFKQGLSQAAVGTPLEQWPAVTRAQVRELAYFNVRTVEQLAQISDAAASQMGPVMALRKKAQDWLATSRGMAPVAEARAEAERARSEVAELRRQIEEMKKSQSRQQQR